jgi:peptidase C39-like protein
MIANAIRSAATTVLTTTGALALAATAHATTPALHGNPTAAAPYWRHQTLDDCALMATADVIGQLTGHEPSERAIIKVAKSTPSQAHPGSVYIPPTNTNDPNSGNGTDPADIPQLLAHYHLHGRATDNDHTAKTGVPTGIEALTADLDAGRRVIAGVNAELLWHQSGDITHADHAVVVTGVDTASNLVHLNDSGNPQGRDEQIDLGIFVKSWQTSNDFIIVASR